MKIVVAMDSFKGSLTSLQAGAAVKEAALRVDPAAEVAVLPLADGGEGTVRAVRAAQKWLGLMETGSADETLLSLLTDSPLGQGMAVAYGIQQQPYAMKAAMPQLSKRTTIATPPYNPKCLS